MSTDSARSSAVHAVPSSSESISPESPHLCAVPGCGEKAAWRRAVPPSEESTDLLCSDCRRRLRTPPGAYRLIPRPVREAREDLAARVTSQSPTQILARSADLCLESARICAAATAALDSARWSRRLMRARGGTGAPGARVRAAFREERKARE